MSKKAFVNSKKTQDAVIRNLEIISEATKNIPKEFIEKHSEVPWSKMARMRDKLIHGYFGVDMNLTWDVVKDELPDIKVKIENILEEEKENEKKD